MMSAAQLLNTDHGEAPTALDVTLLELVQAVGEITSDDREVIATIHYMLKSGCVRLCGNFRGMGPEALS